MYKAKYVVFFMIFLLLNSCKYPGIKGTVVNAETGEPISGAVVLVEWTKSSGGWMGVRTTETYKLVEVVTNKKGKFRVPGIINPFVNPPIMVIYKKGYVAWRNDYIFPYFVKRKDFQWQNNYIFRLEGFKKIYSHSRHLLFFQSDLGLNSSSRLEQAFSWEVPFARKEEELLREKRKTKRSEEYTEKEIWREIIDELYLQKGEDINE